MLQKRRFRVRDFLSFRSMMVPALVQVIFSVGTFLLILGGIAMWFSANSSLRASQTDSNIQTTIALLLIFVGPFALRIVCESIVVFFRINETLTEIKNLLEKQSRQNT